VTGTDPRHPLGFTGGREGGKFGGNAVHSIADVSMKRRFMIRLLATAWSCAPLWESTAFAEGKETCAAAASKGQRLREAHQLVEAREELRVCSAAQCPSELQNECATLLADVERALPSVVVTAKDSTGADLVDVEVSVDGLPLLQKLDGLSVAMNAGPHTFHFEWPGVGSIERSVLVRDGEKHQLVAVTFGMSVPAPSPGAAASAGPAAPAKPPPSSPAKTIGWAIGGIGIVGLGLGTVSGLIAVVNKNGAHCDASGACDAGTVSGIKTAALLSDIGFVAGGVLLASGVSLIVFAPEGAHGPAAALRLTPVAIPSGAAILAGGSWR